jgi:hypothetical protein
MSRRLANPIQNKEGCDANLEYIQSPQNCDDLALETVTRVILMSKTNVQNGAVPTFATVAALDITANWTIFLTQPTLPAPAVNDTVLFSTTMFEISKDAGMSDVTANSYNNAYVEAPMQDSILRVNFVGISQEQRLQLLTNIKDNRSDLSLWLVTLNNELIYVEDTTLIPRGLDARNVKITEGTLSGGQKMTDIFEFLMPYESSANLRKYKVATTSINLSTIGS